MVLRRQLPTALRVSIGTAEIHLLTFSGPLADAVLAAEYLGRPAGWIQQLWEATDALWNGISTRFVTVDCYDPYGNPPPEGTLITFD